MTYIIRDANEDDLAAIRDVRTSVRENHLSVEQMDARGVTTESVRDALRAAPCIWVAESEGRVIGFSMADTDEGSVFAAFVRPEHEGRGVGRRLMERAEAFLFQRFPRIWLETDGASRAAGFYRHLGWELAETFSDGDERLEKHRAAEGRSRSDQAGREPTGGTA